jgi:transposase, IS5 family
MHMKQMTRSASMGFERHRSTHRAQFLAQMHQVVPWATLCALIEPHCRKGLTRPSAMRLEQMLRIYCLQHWFSLPDAAAEHALYDSVAMREFVGIDLGREPVSDVSTIGRFRLLLAHHGLRRQILAAVSQLLRAAGLKLSIGMTVDPRIVRAPRWIGMKTICVTRRARELNVSEDAPS